MQHVHVKPNHEWEWNRALSKPERLIWYNHKNCPYPNAKHQNTFTKFIHISQRSNIHETLITIATTYTSSLFFQVYKTSSKQEARFLLYDIELFSPMW